MQKTPTQFGESEVGLVGNRVRVVGVAKKLVPNPIVLHPTNTNKAVNKTGTHSMWMVETMGKDEYN